MKQIFLKNKIDTGETVYFVIGPFVLPILFVSTLASERAVLYGYVTLSIIVLWTTKLLSSFL